MVTLFILSLVLCFYFSSLSRFIPNAVQSPFTKDAFDKKEFILFRFIEDLVTSNAFYFYISLVLGYFISFVLSGYIIYKWSLQSIIWGVEQPILFGLLLFILYGIIFLFIELISVLLCKLPVYTISQVLYIPVSLFFLVSYPIIKLFSLVFPDINKLNTSFNSDFLGEKNIPILLNNPGVGKLKGKFDQELKILQNALVFSKTRIRDCMIPRTEVEAVEINSSMDEVKSKFISTRYSKLVVYDENIDNIVGFISSKEMFKQPKSLSEKLSPISFVPESMPANKLLHEFMHYNRSMAVVVDEYGGTSGIVTLEDIMEEIFGDIEDEHDTDDLVEKHIRTNEYILSGRLEIEYLNATYNLQIAEKEEYGTLAGFILFHYQNLPKVNDIIKIEAFSIKILKVTNTRIDLVLLKINQE